MDDLPILMSSMRSFFCSVPEWPGTEPVIGNAFGRVPNRFDEFEVILRPDVLEPEWWAGAPSLVRDDHGIFWMACRMRTAEGLRGLRGYEIRILRSEDGVQFERVHSIMREDVPIPGFERPAMVVDPTTRKFKLYACGPWQEGPWSIIKFDDADSPDRFIASSARPVVEAPVRYYERDMPPAGFKDPVIVFAEGAYHMYVIGVVRNTERVFHFVSADGEAWEPVGNPYTPIMPLNGWHDFYVRPASILPVGIGYLFIYEGSATSWYDPVYNIVMGLGFSFDLHTITDLTPQSPLVKSTTPNAHFHTWRYSHWMWVDDEIWVYAEAAAEDETNEIRLFRVKRAP